MLEDILKELDDVLEEITSTNEDILDQLQDPAEHELALKYMEGIEEKHQSVTDKIRSHLQLRANETRSEVSSAKSVSAARSHASTVSRASSASKEAQIGARLQQMRVQQLERRLEEEREAQRLQQEAQQRQREAERSARLAEARDAAALATKEAELRKAAESELTWDRIDDFRGEPTDAEKSHRQEPLTANGSVMAQNSTDKVTEVCPSAEDSAARASCTAPLSTARDSGERRTAAAVGGIPLAERNQVTSHEIPALSPSSYAHPAFAEPKRSESNESWIYQVKNRPPDATSADHMMGVSHRNVPQIQLPKFSGKAIEWPQWISLFKTLIHEQRSLSNSEKLAHLQSSVTGVAKQAVEGMLFDGELYPVALQTLKERFGREGDIVNANLSSIFSIPPMKEIDPPALENLCSVVHCAVTVLKSLGFNGDLNSTENLRRIVLKLPNELKREWGRQVVNMEPKRANLHDFDCWLSQQVRILATVPVRSFEPKGPPRRGSSRIPAHRTPSGPVALTTAPRVGTESRQSQQREDRSKSPSHCGCEGHHKLATCPAFLQKTPEQRAKFVGESGRCFACLKHGHRSRHCTSVEKCGEGGCQGKHHRTLHGSGRVFSRLDEAGGAANRPTVAVTTPQRDETTLLQIVPVRVHGEDSYVDTFAILDSGAQVSLCTENIARKLKLKGEAQPLSLNNVEGSGQRRMALKTSMKLTPLARDSEPGSIMATEVWTVPRLNVPSPQISSRTRAQWQHLEGLDITLARPDQVEVLLGANVLEAILQREVRIGRQGQPIAIKSHFGWALCGRISCLVPAAGQHVMHVHRSTSKEDELNEMVQNWWNTETFGAAHSETKPRSQEDRRAVKILEENTRLVDGRFESGLLWKSDNVSMPDNRLGALRRLERTEKSLRRNPEKAEKYKEIIENYVRVGHARKLDEDEIEVENRKRWLLPHHSVSNPNKPGKIRMVFDAAAEFKGTSLNNELLTGPDLLQELPGILIRFRERLVAIAGDIDQMFLQVKIQQQDRPALSFLWRNMEHDRPPDTYEMTKAIFGAKCSPAIASYVLQKAIGNQRDGDYHWTADQLSKQFYMDDVVCQAQMLA